jgi:hypothetical protein
LILVDAYSYSAPLYIDVKKRVLVQESDEPDPETGELVWTEEKDDDEAGEEEKIYIGKVRRGRPFSRVLVRNGRG